MPISVFEQFPSVVIFDLDNTLYEYAPAHEAAERAVRNKAQQLIGVDPNEFEMLIGRAKKEVKDRLGNVASSHSRLLYFQKLIELVGLRTQPLLTLDLEQTYWRSFLGSATLCAGVNELLDELQLHSIHKVLVTDLTAQIQFRKLVYFRLDESFDAVVTSEEAGVEKPSRRPFDMALEKLKLSEPRGPIWMIGDDVTKDLLPAKEHFGALTFLKRHERSFEGAGGAVDHVFHDFGYVTSLIRRLASLGEQNVKSIGGSKA